MNRSTKIALYVSAAMLFAGGHAVAFDGSWGSSEVFSGSANNFSASADFRDAGAALGGVAATGWNSGSANARADFSTNNFSSHADSWNDGGVVGIGGVAGSGMDRANFSFDVQSMGQSFGEVKIHFDRR